MCRYSLFKFWICWLIFSDRLPIFLHTVDDKRNRVETFSTQLLRPRLIHDFLLILMEHRFAHCGHVSTFRGRRGGVARSDKSRSFSISHPRGPWIFWLNTIVFPRRNLAWKFEAGKQESGKGRNEENWIAKGAAGFTECKRSLCYQDAAMTHRDFRLFIADALHPRKLHARFELFSLLFSVLLSPPIKATIQRI